MEEFFRDLGAAGRAKESRVLYILELNFLFRLLRKVALLYALLFSPNDQLGNIRAVSSPLPQKLMRRT